MIESANKNILAGGNVICPRDKIIMTRPVEATRNMIFDDTDPLVLLAPSRLALGTLQPFEEIASSPIPSKLSMAIYRQILTQTIFSAFYKNHSSLLETLCILPGPYARAHTIAMLNSRLSKKDFRRFMRAYGKLYGQNCHSTALYTASALLKLHPERLLKKRMHTASAPPFASLNFIQMRATLQKIYPKQHKLLKWRAGQSDPEEIFINNNPHLVSIFDVHRSIKSREIIWHTDIHSLIAFKLHSEKRKCAYYLAFEKAGLAVSSSAIDGAIRFVNLTCSLNSYTQSCRHDAVILSVALEG